MSRVRLAGWYLSSMRRALFGLLICVPLLLHAQSGEWGSRGISHRFVVLGQRGFDADGRGVTLYDVSQAHVRQLIFAATGADSVDLQLGTDYDLTVATRGCTVLRSVAWLETMLDHET